MFEQCVIFAGDPPCKQRSGPSPLRQKDKKEVILPKPDLPGGKGGSLVERTTNESEGVLMLTATVIRRWEALGTISQQGKR
jgi:hypothetical protein